jgi:hypothetical protein
MTNKFLENESPLTALKSESARQRWEMFHRAIAHAKQSNSDALLDDEPVPSEPVSNGPLLSVVR